jgi:sulfofructose kinase
MQRLDVIGIGHVTCDIICPLQDWPVKDTKTIIPGIRLSGGGPTANAMAALAKLGVACGLAGRLGDDLLGRFTLEQHTLTGMDVSHLQLHAGTTSPVSVILSDLSDATRTILLTKGENTVLDPADLDYEWLHQARFIHFDGHQIPASIAAARAAKDWPDTSTMLDAGSLREGMLELCGLVDYAIASLHFAKELTGSADPLQCITALHSMGARYAGVTLGANGAVLSADGEVIYEPAVAVDVKDTTGAGDAFHGGLIYALLQSVSWRDCLCIANTVAAIKCTGLGARDALPDQHSLAHKLDGKTSVVPN